MSQEKYGHPLHADASARAWPRLAALALAAALLLLTSVTLAPQRPTHATGACANGGYGACIEFLVSHYTANNTPIIGGPASTAVEFLGGGFLSVAGKTITFGVVKGDDIMGTSPSPSFCTHSPISVPGSTTVTSTGTFSTVTIYWPTGTSIGDWSVCAYHNGAAVGNTDNFAWPVSSPYRPTVSVSPSYLASGGVVTVTGHGWVPAQNGINVTIAPCDGCSAIARYGDTISSSSGYFSVKLTIPAGAAHGKYLVRGMGTVIGDSSSESGPYLWIGVMPTPTPRPTPRPTPTPKPTATTAATATTIATATPFVAATATPAVVVAAGSGGPWGGSGGWLAVGLGALLVVLIGGGLLAWALIRRRAA
ncbi:MAG: hypothetical protein KGO05_15945 [Chloroflexota bacterium]|nr:hypothetical protein [Chloroflexota bacterium]